MALDNSSIEIQIDRNNLINDAFDGIMLKSPQELKRKLKINYVGEEGIDVGGLLR